MSPAVLLAIGGALLLYVMHQSAGAAQQSGVSNPMVQSPLASGTQSSVSSSNPMAAGTQQAFFSAAPTIPAMGPPPGEVITAPGSPAVYDTGTWSNPQIVDNTDYLTSHPVSAYESGQIQNAPAATVGPPDVDSAGFLAPEFSDTNSPMAQLYHLLWTYYREGPLAAANWATLVVTLTGGTMQGPNAAVLFPDNPIRYMTLNEYFRKLQPYMLQHFGLSGLGRWRT